METIKLIYNSSVFFQFLSAIFSIILSITVIYIKRENERNNKRNYYNGVNAENNVLGDINIKIDEELPRRNYIELMTMWGIQPLLLLVLISFTYNQFSYLKICLFFALLIFTLLHEFLTGLKLSGKSKYQILMLIVWLMAFSILSFEKNTITEVKHDNPIVQTGK